ncbi:DUF998 domain-containing protein [Streptomyces huasconensis]|uniref:DUF998 domain-containing protein n=1 Tax=Streptomyces huasconensis TaxID=1854574 RepID=A0ABV3LYH8_9ACTN
MVVDPLFTATYLVAGAVRADYEPLRHPVSSLALGRGGWVQTANFLCAALLSSAFAVGLWCAGASPWGALLVGGWAVGLLGAGLFRTDPVAGYLRGTPHLVRHPTRAGARHDALSLCAFLALTAACFVFAPSGSPGWAACSVGSGVLFAVTVALSSAAFDSGRWPAGFGGRFQRISLAIAWIWLAVLAFRALRA